jgi:predicted short-subunit dehydrogenase-like oxidoreductase (DUF2520 family)
MRSTDLSIGIVGYGKVGKALVHGLSSAGVQVKVIISRSSPALKKEESFTDWTYFKHTDDVTSPSPDLWIICVPDDSIAEVVRSIATRYPDTWMAHTSGGFDTLALIDEFPGLGVFYPLQSFSDKKIPDWQSIPICIQAEHKELESHLTQLASLLSLCVYKVAEADRVYLHLAAVFINNFTNAMCQIANDVLASRDLPFELVQPLLLETAEKLKILTPLEAQTGPAIRNDQSTILKHRQLLDQYPKIYGEIYQIITQFIQK